MLSIQQQLNPRVKYNGKYWYLAFLFECIGAECKLSSEKIGIDLGAKDLAVVSNGLVFKNINKSII